MANGCFEKAVEVILREEGGYVNDPKDPGGETNFGISKRQFPMVDVRDLTREQAADIYYAHYWRPIRGDKLPWPLALFVFDAAVNQGCDAAAGFAAQKMLQKALGVAQDGVMGPATMAAVNAARPFHAAKFMAIRAQRYQGTRNFDKYGEGWLTRLFRVAMESGK